ncbi:MAG: hypothetical protein K2K75_06885 [Muribaculaceae bacterium]|nr:hypothetical protein [Muribaculaceae bacterium]
MHSVIIQVLWYSICILCLCGSDLRAANQLPINCMPLTTENTIEIKLLPSSSCGGQEFVLLLKLMDDFHGKMRLNSDSINLQGLSVYFKSDTTIKLTPIMDDRGRSCRFLPAFPAKEENCSIAIPAGYFEIEPLDYIEVDEIDIEQDLLCSLSVAGAWHKSGKVWNGSAMFSIIDDDGLEPQFISSSSPYGGYFSLLYPLLESLGLKGNLAVEGRRIGLCDTPPVANDNLKTILRLQNEKGWDILSHSMMCLGEILNNWVVDSLNSRLANKILTSGPNNGEDASTVSVYDLQTRKQYWPNPENTSWVETPSIFIKPYAGDYKSKKEVMYNPDFNIDWHWGEWKRRAKEFGIDPKGFVTHNSTSSHALVGGILEYFPHGFSDHSTKNINTVPMLSSAVRAGLEGQSIKGYKGETDDNSFNKKHYKAFRSLIDEAARCGGWIMFNLHTYRACWKNSLPGALVSEGGKYPDEWVIPMKGIESTKDPLTPPARLGISDWSEWYPCPGTRLDMMWQVLKYAKEKGLVNVTSSEGFDIMGNRQATGYFNHGYVFGMNHYDIIGTRNIYPHYVMSATEEEFYYNTLFTEDISIDIGSYISKIELDSGKNGNFSKFGSFLIWEGADMPEIKLKAFDITGKEVLASKNNLIDLRDLIKGTYIVSAFNGKSRINTIKILR